MEQTETILVEQLKKGNERAFQFLYERHYAILCHIAENYVKDQFVAETIVGDTIFHIWEIRETLEITTSLRRYLMQAVRNRCINYLNTENYRKEIVFSLLPDTEQLNNKILIDDSQPLGTLLEQELETKIEEAITQLPKECQRVFIKSRFDGKSYEEISQELNISVNTVKYHIKNALASLRRSLEKYLICFFYFFFFIGIKKMFF